jgi:hypothetical protein
MGKAIRKRFDQPDETRTFEHGELQGVQLVGAMAGKATFQPGWTWSHDVKPLAGTERCEAHHIGYALSGQLHVVTAEGEELEISAGDVYEVLPGHDAWVVGDQPFEGLEFQSGTVETYAKA